MPRTLASITAAYASPTSATLTFTYAGSYAGLPSDGACDPEGVAVILEKNDITAGTGWTAYTTVSGGTSGEPSTVATGLTTGHTYEFRGYSVQRRWVDTGGTCDPVDTDTSSTLTSNQVTVAAPINATLARTLGAATLSSSATHPVTGTLAKTLDAATVAAEIRGRFGTLSQTLGAATVSSGATHPVTGTLSRTLGVATLSALSKATVGATLARTLDAAGFSSTAAVFVVAHVNVTLDSPTLDFTAVQPWWRVSPTAETWTGVPATSEIWTPVPTTPTVWN